MINNNPDFECGCSTSKQLHTQLVEIKDELETLRMFYSITVKERDIERTRVNKLQEAVGILARFDNGSEAEAIQDEWKITAIAAMKLYLEEHNELNILTNKIKKYEELMSPDTIQKSEMKEDNNE